MSRGYRVEQLEGCQLNANEKPANLPPEIIEEIKGKLPGISFNRYPDDGAKDLCEAYGTYAEVAPEQIIAGNGSDEILGLLIATYINKGQKLYTLDPDFSMYDYYVQQNEGEVIPYSLGVQKVFDVEEFIAKGKESQVDLIIFSNPNNPTGQVIEDQEILKIIEAFSDIPVIIDEAYTEFYGRTMAPYLSKYHNLGITRTLSKAFGLAAIRCGFLLAHPEIIAHVRPLKVPYNVNSLTQLVATTVLNHCHLILKDVADLCEARDVLYKNYSKLAPDCLKLYPSQANYFYGVCQLSSQVPETFAASGIAVRQMGEGVIRLTVGTASENDKVLEVLKKLKGMEKSNEKK
ncbi:histidinol-phosphate transaminase [Vagococcus elongatus]|nr:histidinol-phosphate transaminase [Vagococcus elongatus]